MFFFSFAYPFLFSKTHTHRILDHQRTPVNRLKNSTGNGFNGNGDSLSWAEDISSISSAFISTKSEPPAMGHSRDRSLSQQQAAVAQRDYRLQSYKCPQNFVLPELQQQHHHRPRDAEQRSNCDSSTTGVSIVTSASKQRKQKPNAAHCLPETTVKVLETTVDSTSAAAANNRLLLSAVGDELQTNRLFVSVHSFIFFFIYIPSYGFIHSLHWASFSSASAYSFSSLSFWFLALILLIDKEKENGITMFEYEY